MALRIQYGGLAAGRFEDETPSCPSLGGWPGFDYNGLPAVGSTYDSFQAFVTANAALVTSNNTSVIAGLPAFYFFPDQATIDLLDSLVGGSANLAAYQGSPLGGALSAAYAAAAAGCAVDYPLTPTANGEPIAVQPFGFGRFEDGSGSIFNGSAESQVPVFSFYIYDDADPAGAPLDEPAGLLGPFPAPATPSFSFNSQVLREALRLWSSSSPTRVLDAVFQQIETELALYADNVLDEGQENEPMKLVIDLNGNRLLNLAAPTGNPQEIVTRG